MLLLSAILAVLVLAYTSSGPSVQEQARRLRPNVASLPVAQDIHLRLADPGFRFPDLAAAVQKQLDFRLHSLGCPYKYRVVDDIPASVQRPDQIRGPDPVFCTETNSGLSSPETPAETPETAHGSAPPPGAPPYAVELHFWYQPGVWLDPHNFTAHMSYDLSFIHQNDLPFFVTQAIFDTLISADLAMWAGGGGYGAYVQDYKIAFVAAEESGPPPAELAAELATFAERYAAVAPMTNVTSCIEAVDVSKHRVPAQHLRNSSQSVNFLFSTSLRGYADSIQGVPLFHLDKLARLESVPGAEYGTARDVVQERLIHDAYDVSAFLQMAGSHIDSALGLVSGPEPLAIRVHAAMKHYALSGLCECLDMLASSSARDRASRRAYYSVCGLVDAIMAEGEHDWRERLSQVAALHAAISSRT